MLICVNDKDCFVGNVFLIYDIIFDFDFFVWGGIDVWIDIRILVMWNERVKSGVVRM